MIRQRVAGKKNLPPFHYRSKGNLATVGRGFALVESGPIRLSGSVAWLIWLSVHIVYLVGFCNRFLVLLQWAWAYLTRQRSARLITCEPLAEMHEQERETQGRSMPIPTEETADSSTHTVNQERRNYADRHAQDSAL